MRHMSWLSVSILTVSTLVGAGVSVAQEKNKQDHRRTSSMVDTYRAPDDGTTVRQVGVNAQSRLGAVQKLSPSYNGRILNGVVIEQ